MDSNRGKRWACTLRHLLASLHTPACAVETPAPAAHQRGVSLLIAIMTVAVMVVFVSEMIVSATVNLELAIITRDRVKAEYLSKSGVNLGLYLLSVSYLWDHAQKQFSGLAGGGGENHTDGPASLWNIMNTWPPLGRSTVDLLQLASQSQEDNDVFGLSGFLNEKLAGQMGLFEDHFSTKISDEGYKINVNQCTGSGDAARVCPHVIAQLEALFSCSPAEKRFLQNKNITPRELAYRIRDFISSDTQVSPESNLSSKDDPYERKSPPYKAKGLPLDTLSELKMISGWDDEIHAVFSPYIRTYPYKGVKAVALGRKASVAGLNLNTAPPELLGCLLPKSRQDGCREKSAQQLHQLRTKKLSNVAASEAQVKSQLDKIFCTSPDEEDPDAPQYADWFTVHSEVFRIQVEAETGHQRRSLFVIIRRVDKGMKELDIEKRPVQRSYQVLYWRLS